MHVSRGILRTTIFALALVLSGCDSEAETAADAAKDAYVSVLEDHPGVEKMAPTFVRSVEQFELHAEKVREKISPVTYRDPSKTSLQQYGLLLELRENLYPVRTRGEITADENTLISKILNSDFVEITKLEDLSRSYGYKAEYEQKARDLRKSQVAQ